MACLLELPDDMLRIVATQDSSVACNLREAHLSLATLLDSYCKELKKGMYRFRAAGSAGCFFQRNGRRAICNHRYGWAEGSALPSIGRHSWTVHVEHVDPKTRLGMVIGVCDEAGIHGWGLHPYYGEVWRAFWQGPPCPAQNPSAIPWRYDPTLPHTKQGRVEYAVRNRPPPPPGFPDSNDLRIMLGLAFSEGATFFDMVIDVTCTGSHSANTPHCAFSPHSGACTVCGTGDVRCGRGLRRIRDDVQDQGAGPQSS